MFVPLIHPPGHAQADFGEARAVIGGIARKAHFFVFDLPHSDACYVRAYPAATAEAWMDGHVHAFAFFGGVILRGHRETIGERLARDVAAMAAPPATPFEACDRAPGQVSSQSLVRYRTNDYSVPVAYGHRAIWVRGYVDRVAIGCGGDVIARHPRSYEREDMIFEPIHYLPLIEQKIGALDQAAPLAGWDLPPAFQTLRRLMEARAHKAGRREYVQVLRLLESFGLEDLHAAVKDALRLGAIGFDAVKHLVLCRLEKRPPKLDLDVYPYLPKATVGKTSAASYMCLLSEDAA